MGRSRKSSEVGDLPHVIDLLIIIVDNAPIEIITENTTSP